MRLETRCHVTATTLDNSVLDHISSSSIINIYVHQVVGVKPTNVGQLAFLFAGGFRTWARHSVIRALTSLRENFSMLSASPATMVILFKCHYTMPKE